MKYKKFTIIGSGVSGINAALTLLQKGHSVDIIDLDDTDNNPASKGQTFDSIKKNNNFDSLKFFYGDSLDHLLNSQEGNLFTFPKRRKGISKNNIFEYDQNIDVFEPHHGYCRGGLGSFWGANSIEFNQDDLINFGVNKNEFGSIYKDLSNRFMISGGIDDDISSIANESFQVKHSRKMSPQELKLFEEYKKLKNNKFKIGLSRLAINSDPLSKNACYNSGLCIWRCPNSSIYDPKQTLRECFNYINFSYKNGFKVLYLEIDKLTPENIQAIVCSDKSNNIKKIKVENIILAAGAINSSIIYLRSLYENGLSKSNKVRSMGLMDTQVVKIPYINPFGFRSEFYTNKIQFNNLVSFIKIESNNFPDWAQAELLSLGSLIYYPLINKIGLGIKNSLFGFNLLKNALNVSSIFVPDKLDSNNFIELDFSRKKIELNFNYNQSKTVGDVKNQIIDSFVFNMRRMGMLISKRSAIHFKHGDGIHYAGTIPISDKKMQGCVDSDCKSYDFNNLHVVDGSVFPTLPSKSITLNLAANSIRVAQKL